MERMKSILITGGAGGIGRYAVEYYLNKGYLVFIYDKDAEAMKELRSNFAFETLRLDIIDLKNYEALWRSLYQMKTTCHAFNSDLPEYVLHLAGDPDLRKSVDDPLSNTEDNVMATVSLLEALNQFSFIKNIAFASSGSVYGETTAAHIEDACVPASPYAASKLCCEHYIKVYELLHGFKPTCFRFFNVVMSGGKEGNVVPIWIKRAIEKKPLIINGDGTITRDYIACEDLIMLIDEIMHMEDRKFLYNLGYGKSTSLNELAKMIQDVTYHDAKIEHGPAKAGDVHDSVAVLDKTVKKLIKDKSIGLVQGIRNTANSIYKRYTKDN